MTGRRTFLGCIGSGAAALGGPRRKPPNVVVFLTDDQGYCDLGCHGNPQVRTPHMDALHRVSARLTDFHVDPTCSPTRSALMTGRYSHRVGVWHTIMGRDNLRRSEMTMADVFRHSGYRTGLFGKWHLGNHYPFRPVDRGFQRYVWADGVGGARPRWENCRWDDVYETNEGSRRLPGYATDAIVSEALRFIDESGEAPFFAYVATAEPHDPHNLPAVWAEPYRKMGLSDDLAFYFGAIERVDYNLGRIRRRLEERGLAGNTIVIFATDNGTTTPGGFTGAMRGKKGSQYDGGHRGACFIHWPQGGLNRGRDITELAAHIDMLPTLIDLCGLQIPRQVHLDGTSLRPLLLSSAESWPARTLVVESQRIVAPEKWRQCSVMTNRWRLVNGTELYDIRRDPEQKNNVAALHAAEVARLRDEYGRWWDSVTERDSEYNRPIVGSENEPESYLTSMEWVPEFGEIPWQRRHVVDGLRAAGHWPVEFARSGTYEFELRRWPRELDRPMQAGPPPARLKKEVALRGILAPYGTGAALPIASGRLRVQGREASHAVGSLTTVLRMRLPCEAGPAEIHAAMLDAEGRTICGAYYVYVRRLSA